MIGINLQLTNLTIAMRKAISARILITLNGVDEYFTLENPVVETGDFEISLDVYTASNSSLQTLIGTPTGSDSFFRLDNISTSAVIKVKLGGVELPIPAATLTLNKLHNLRISRVGTTFTVHVDGVESGSETNAAWGADFEIGKIGTLGSNLQFFNGIIANPDFGNGNAWQLNRALPATTEQSTDGTNLLTYVGAPKTELFTFNQSAKKWNGSNELVVNGGFGSGDLTNWTERANSSISVVNSQLNIDFTTAGPTRTSSSVPTLVGGTYTLKTLGVLIPIDVVWKVYIGTSFGVDDLGIFDLEPMFSTNFTSEGQETFFEYGTSIAPLSSSNTIIDDVSIKRFIQSAT